MEFRADPPTSKRVALATKSAPISALIGTSVHPPDGWLIRTLRRSAGTNQFPMGQKSLEKCPSAGPPSAEAPLDARTGAASIGSIEPR